MGTTFIKLLTILLNVATYDLQTQKTQLSKVTKAFTDPRLETIGLNSLMINKGGSCNVCIKGFPKFSLQKSGGHLVLLTEYLPVISKSNYVRSAIR